MPNNPGQDKRNIRRDAATWARWLESGILLAVSGGADSTALLHKTARFAEEHALPKPAVGHVNHRLRGQESDDDARFVRKTAEEYGIRYFEHLVSPEQWAEDSSGSREAAARTIRYEFLVRSAENLGFRYVATAHTADDHVETVLHRILRGTGLTGLAGIAPFRQISPAITLVRPLLEFRRSDILEYLRSLDKPFRVDSTNLEDGFTRNRIRNRLLPEIRRSINPEVDAALDRLAFLAGESESVLSDLVENLFGRIVLARFPEEIVFDSTELRKFQAATIREIFLRVWRENGWPLREMGLEQWTGLVGFFLSGRGKRSLYGGVVAEHGSVSRPIFIFRKS